MLPEMPMRISSSVGDGFSLSRRCARTIMPGVQKPHCSPCIMRKPSCSADSEPSALAMPSMVVISEPCACTANTVQLFTDMPSRSTVQAPQWVVSQPTWVPVSERFSRRECTSSVRGSTRPSTSAPFTFMVTWVFAIFVPLSFRSRRGALQRAHHHDAPDMPAVLDRPAGIRCRRHDRLRGGSGPFQRGLIEARSDHGLGRVDRKQRRFVHIRESYRAGGDLAPRHREHYRGRSGGVVAD